MPQASLANPPQLAEGAYPPQQSLSLNGYDATTLQNQLPLPQFDPSPPNLQQQQFPQQAPPLTERRSSERVPIPHANSSQATGPMSTPVILRGRPKPGRKPIPHDDAQDRRRQQNRQAQRNFRDKRQQKLFDCQEELVQSKKAYENHLAQISRENDALKNELDRVKQKCLILQKQLMHMPQRKESYQGRNSRSNASSFSSDGSFSAPQMPNHRQPRFQGPSRGDPATMTPPEFAFNEVDYTNFGRLAPSMSNNNHPSVPSDSTFVGYPSDLQQPDDGDCGFCTDPQNCFCKQATNAEPAPQPGNCDACLADPNRAQACRQVAASAQTLSEDNLRMYESAGQPYPGSGSRSGSKISCEQLMDRATQSGQKLASIPELFKNQVHVHPSANGRYEVDEQEAAQALQTLSRRRTRTSQQGVKK